MGSSGSGSFTDYSGSKKPDGTGGSSGKDPCRTAFAAKLEEVEQCDFFVTNNTVPAADTVLSIVFEGRIFAVTENGTKVGALPMAARVVIDCAADDLRFLNPLANESTSQVNMIQNSLGIGHVESARYVDGNAL